MSKNNKRRKQRKCSANQPKFKSPQIWFHTEFNRVFGVKGYRKLVNHLKSNVNSINSAQKLSTMKQQRVLANELIRNILKHKETITRLINFIIKHHPNKYSEIVQKFIYFPWSLVGNKYHPLFNQFYEFLSQFDLAKANPESEETVLVFRVLDEEEFLRLESGLGVESPSYTLNPMYLQFMRGNSTYMDIAKKSIFIFCEFHISDIIVHYNLSGENEIVVKKGALPKNLGKYCEYGIEDAKSDLGEGVVAFLPLKEDELNNGYTYMDALISKGYCLKGWFERDGQWFKSVSESNDWIRSYIKGLSTFILNYRGLCESQIKPMRMEFEKLRYLDGNLLYNPMAA